MALMYPKKNSRIYIPVDIDGTSSKTVFEATHRNNSAVIYWHMDDVYIGSTQEVHQLVLAPALGKHVLTLVDENGASVTQSFEVLGKN